MTEQSNPSPSAHCPTIARQEWRAVLAACTLASLAAILWSWRNHALLNYGDAVAHLHIARRIFDSRTPRFSQLGSVWLPLPHILMIPFVQVYGWWANGIAGIVPSALAYIASCAGIYRLLRRWLPVPAATVALAFFAVNPNLLYLQTTAMTEPLFLCLMIWLTVWLVDWRAALDANPVPDSRLLWLIALASIAAIYTRYDGWIMAFLAWVAIAVTLARRGRLRTPAFWLAGTSVLAAPIVWLLYNAVAFHDWLFFMRGPYSAKAIEIRTSTPGFPPHPGWHNPWVSFLFFMKAAELDAVARAWGNVLLAISALGAAFAWITARRRALAWALLLAFPIPFYAYSIAWGSVPIFLPTWWPHSYYNLRYGMELLPGLSLGLGFSIEAAVTAYRRRMPAQADHRAPNTVAAIFLSLVTLNVLQMLHERPLVYVEGTKNIDAHRPYQQAIPAALKTLLAAHPGATILVDTSVDPEIIALTGIPLRQTINEADLQIWENALAAPAAHAAIILALDGDDIDRAVHAHPQGLTVYRRFSAPFMPNATLYVSDTPGA